MGEPTNAAVYHLSILGGLDSWQHVVEALLTLHECPIHFSTRSGLDCWTSQIRRELWAWPEFHCHVRSRIEAISKVVVQTDFPSAHSA